MSRTSIIAILACAGVIFTGELTAEASAFARVVQSGDPVVLQRFAQQYPQSQFAPLAIQIAEQCNTNWVGGGCGPNADVEHSHQKAGSLQYGKSG